MQIPFVGPTYSAASPNIDVQRSVNWYPEFDNAYSKTVMAMIGTPGSKLFCALGANVVRGMHEFGGNMYVVAGSSLFSVNIFGVVSASLGTLNTSDGRVTMKDNGILASGVGGNQLIIVDGINGYIYNINTLAFSVIASAGFASQPISVEFIDGYFVAVFRGSMKFSVSDLYDGTSWNALAVAAVAATPDPILAVVNSHQQLWFLKSNSSEVWYDAGIATTSGCPFQRMGGGVADFGIVSSWAFCKSDNSLLWAATQMVGDKSEFVGIVELNGYVPTLISPVCINYQMSQWGTYGDVFGYSYSQDGHTFCLFTSPSGNQTFVVDTTTRLWHERSVWSGMPYAIGRHHSNAYCYFNNKHYIGDYRSGNILEMNNGFYDDNGDPIVSVRQTQHLSDNKGMLHNLFLRKLQVDMETGYGTDPVYYYSGGVWINSHDFSPITIISEPKAALSWSDDGGRTWSSEYEGSTGGVGEYKKRVVWKRLGRFRDRVFRLAVSSYYRRILLGAYAE